MPFPVMNEVVDNYVEQFDILVRKASLAGLIADMLFFGLLDQFHQKRRNKG